MKYLIVTIINKLRINVGDFKDPLTASSTFVNLVLFIKYFDSWIRIQEARGSNGSESKVLQKRSLFISHLIIVPVPIISFLPLVNLLLLILDLQRGAGFARSHEVTEQLGLLEQEIKSFIAGILIRRCCNLGG